MIAQPGGRFRYLVRTERVQPAWSPLRPLVVGAVSVVFLATSATIDLSGASDEPSASPAPLSGATLESFLRRAQEANPELQAFRRRYEAALNRVPQARSLPDPMLQVTHFVESMQTPMGPQNQELMFSQQIPWFGKRGTREAVASAEAEALWYAFQYRQLMLTQTVAEAFFEYAFTGKASESEAQNIRLLEELEPNVQEKVRTGGDLNSLLRLKVEIGRAADRLRSLEQQRRAQSARLAGLLGLPPGALLPWPEWEVPVAVGFEYDDLTRAMEANNPELAMLERQIASAQAGRVLARLEGRPDVTFGVNYMIMGEAPGPSMDSDRNPWGVTFGLNVPLWQGKYRAQRREAASLQHASERERDDRLNMLRAELAASMADLQDAQRRLKLYGEELLDLARQSLEITRSSYQGDRAGIIEVIDSERSLIELELLYWRAAADASQQLVNLQVLANRPIQGTFQAAQSE